MSDAIAALAALYSSHFNCDATDITPVAASGGYRAYYRVSGPAGTVIGTYGPDVDENRAFIYLARHFRDVGIDGIPEVFAVSDCENFYLQSDAGHTSVFELLAPIRSGGNCDESVVSTLAEAMKLLARVQFVGARNLDFSQCYPESAMTRRQVNYDLNYFKYLFLKPVLGDFNENRLQDELDRLADEICAMLPDCKTFMVRDFQSRNVMVGNDGRLTLIDFQGGRRGPVEYDVASFLWQARAALPRSIKSRLVEYYIRCASEVGAGVFDAAKFRSSLPSFVLFRVLQTLGAYGFRGLYERRPHFVASIPRGVENLMEIVDELNLSAAYPYIAELSAKLSQAYAVRTLSTFTSVPQIIAGQLTVCVSSFSFKKGVPPDLSGNGGGFVFDCRAVHNPGRYEEYRRLTGRDVPVIKFLEDNGEVFEFLNAAYSLVDASVRRYLQRNFSSLCVSFGCTGGQHRSVYCAEAMARHIVQLFPQARVVLWHREQGIIEEFNR